MSAPRGRAAVFFENDTLRVWWTDGAWAQLAPVLYSIVVQRLPRTLDLDEREDFAQCAVVRCWQSTTIPDAPISFAVAVAYNLVKDHYKSTRVRLRVPWDDTYGQTEDPFPDALAQIMADRPETRLRDALRTLPYHLQRPLILQVYHRRSTKALAEQFGITYGAMKMRLTRARKELRGAYLTGLHAPPTVPVPVSVSPHDISYPSMSVREVLTQYYP